MNRGQAPTVDFFIEFEPLDGYEIQRLLFSTSGFKFWNFIAVSIRGFPLGYYFLGFFNGPRLKQPKPALP